MTLTRLLDDPEDDFESSLLRSARLDLPDEARVIRGVAAVTAAAAVITASGPALGAAAGTSAAALAHVGSGSAGIGPALVLKWLGVGALAGTLVTGTGAYVTTRMDPGAARAPVAAAAVEARPAKAGGKPSPGLVAPAVEPEIFEDVPSTVETPPLPDGPVSPSQRLPSPELAPRPDDPSSGPVPPGPVPPVGASGVPLAAEVEALSRARMALSGRDPVRALGELRQYEITRRTRVLDEEALVLQIEALLQIGQPGKARDLARRHLSTHPGCAHRARLAEITARPNP